MRPGPPYRVAAEKLTRLAGLELTEKAAAREPAVALRPGGAVGAAVSAAAPPRAPGPRHAGLATGATMSAIADELMTPAFGFSAPNLDYPPATHARGFVAHLVFGLAVAATVEAGWQVVGRRP